MSEEIVTIRAENWREEVLKFKELVLVEFWHLQCPYCKVIEPIYIELSKEYAGKLKFAKFNVLENEENQDLASQYGVMGTPTLKFFCQGKPVLDVVGALTEDYIRQVIEFALKNHRDCAEKSTPLKLPYVS